MAPILRRLSKPPAALLDCSEYLEEFCSVTIKREIRLASGGARIVRRHIGPSIPDQSGQRIQKLRPIRCDPRWRAATSSLASSIERLSQLLSNHEGTRLRRRSNAATATFKLAIECICCNLLAVSIAAPDRALAIPLANAASRLTAIFGKPARKVIDLMLAMKLVTKVRGYPYRGPTTISATHKLREHLPLENIGWEALRISGDDNVVLLRTVDGADSATTKNYQKSQQCGSDASEKWLSQIVAEMHAINNALLNAAIECAGTATTHISERPGESMASIVTHHHRTLRRIFNRTWDGGGRLFGGFWQTMPKGDRFNHIRLLGAPIAVIDYGQLFLRIAYSEAGIQPPIGDLYEMSDDDVSSNNWKRMRDAYKKLVNALFFRGAPLNHWPGSNLIEIGKMRESFAPGTTARDAIGAIKRRHAPIAHLFEHSHGFRFMRRESDLITIVTLQLLRQEIVALPIHDAVLVPLGSAAKAKQTMQDEARRLLGVEIPAEIQVGL